MSCLHSQKRNFVFLFFSGAHSSTRLSISPLCAPRAAAFLFLSCVQQQCALFIFPVLLSSLLFLFVWGARARVCICERLSFWCRRRIFLISCHCAARKVSVYRAPRAHIKQIYCSARPLFSFPPESIGVEIESKSSKMSECAVAISLCVTASVGALFQFYICCIALLCNSICCYISQREFFQLLRRKVSALRFLIRKFPIYSPGLDTARVRLPFGS